MLPRKLVRLTSLLRWYAFRLTHKRGFRLYQLDHYKMYIDVGEFFTMFERLIGDFEPDKRRFVIDNVNNGNVFVDIGVNKGDFTLLAASQIGPTGKVIAIEPEPENCSWIRRSIEANGFKSVDLYEAAAAETAGTAKLFLGEKSGWHSLVQGVGASGYSIEVKTIALDDIDDGNLNPDLIKIDVEGAENRVLEGAKAMIDRCRPTFVIDLHPHKGADIDLLEDYFRSRDYNAYSMRDLDTTLQKVLRVPTDVVFRPAET